MGDVGIDVDIGVDGDEGIDAVKELNSEMNKTEDAQKKVSKGADGVNKALKKFLGIATAIAAVGLARKLVKSAKSIDTVANSLEISSEAAQTYAIAAKRVGLELEDLRSVLLNLAREQGAENNLFHTLGFSLEQMRNLNPAQIFEDIATRVNEGKLNAVQMTAAIQLMGGDGERVMRGLTKGFADFQKQAEKSGAAVSGEVVDPLGEAVDRSKVAVDELALSFKSELVPVIETFGQVALPIMNGFSLAVAAVQAKIPTFAQRLKSAVSAAGTAVGSRASQNVLQEMKHNRHGIEKAKKGEELRFIEAIIKQEQALKKLRSDQGGISDSDFKKQLGRGARVGQLAKTIGGSARNPVGDLSSAGIFATRGATRAAGQQQRSLGLLQRISINTANMVRAVNKQ